MLAEEANSAAIYHVVIAVMGSMLFLCAIVMCVLWIHRSKRKDLDPSHPKVNHLEVLQSVSMVPVANINGIGEKQEKLEQGELSRSQMVEVSQEMRSVSVDLEIESNDNESMYNNNLTINDENKPGQRRQSMATVVTSVIGNVRDTRKVSVGTVITTSVDGNIRDTNK